MNTIRNTDFAKSPLGAFMRSPLRARGRASGGPPYLYVLRVGDGSVGLTANGNAVFIDQYTLMGTFIQTFTVPTSASGSNLACCLSGTATSEGYLTAPIDSPYIGFAAYNTVPPYTSDVSSSDGFAVPRVCGFLNVDTGVVDTSSALKLAGYTNNIRCGFVDSLSGGGLAIAGALDPYYISYGTVGSGTSIGGLGSAANQKAVLWQALASVLYFTSGSKVYQWSNYSSLNPSSGTVLFTGGTPEGIWLDTNTGTTMYVADKNLGLQRWDLSGTWSIAYTLTGGLLYSNGIGLKAVAGYYDGTYNHIYATDLGTGASGSTNNLYVLTDTGSGNDGFNLIATSVVDSILQGLAVR